MFALQVLDELVPKAAPGREARLEKKKMMAQKRRDREISPGIIKFYDETLPQSNFVSFVYNVHWGTRSIANRVCLFILTAVVHRMFRGSFKSC